LVAPGLSEDVREKAYLPTTFTTAVSKEIS